jgi:ribonucleotide monophosphatase NagD (HAD superfamily)
VARALGAAPDRLLMVGDSLEHDIAGGHAAGWSTAFVEGGLHRARFAGGDPAAALDALLAQEGAPAPTYTLPLLR